MRMQHSCLVAIDEHESGERRREALCDRATKAYGRAGDDADPLHAETRCARVRRGAVARHHGGPPFDRHLAIHCTQRASYGAT